MKKMITLSLIVFIAIHANAKVWRINNTPGVTADFTSGALAMASPSVLNDDTLHFEASTTNYAGFIISKRVVIIGPGYFLSGTNSNPNLQANPNAASFGNGFIQVDSLASGSSLMGINNFQFTPGPGTGSGTDNITITRCGNFSMINFNGLTPNTKMTGWKINKCYLSGNLGLGIFVVQNWEITNNIFNSTVDISNTGNLNNLVRNNVFRGVINLFSGYFSNNIITASSFTATNFTIKNNISTGTNLPGGNGNVNNSTDAILFQGLAANSTDGQWRLNPGGGNPAIGGGETIAAITPDCGAYGTADPYVLSGIPAVPSIYLLTVPASVPSNATTMPITISTKSNN